MPSVMTGERVPTVSTLGSSGKFEAVALEESDGCLTPDIVDIIHKARSNWLKNEEVLAVLEFFQTRNVEFPDQPAYQPDGTYACLVEYCISSVDQLTF